MDSQVAQVRRFNRTVTQRVGALSDDFLSRSRPLAMSRLLWEIGTEGGEVVMLRARLGVDSGQMSRMLRALEADGLVRVTPSDSDGRVRVARLTERGSRSGRSWTSGVTSWRRRSSSRSATGSAPSWRRP